METLPGSGATYNQDSYQRQVQLMYYLHVPVYEFACLLMDKLCWCFFFFSLEIHRTIVVGNSREDLVGRVVVQEVEEEEDGLISKRVAG